MISWHFACRVGLLLIHLIIKLRHYIKLKETPIMQNAPESDFINPSHHVALCMWVTFHPINLIVTNEGNAVPEYCCINLNVIRYLLAEMAAKSIH